MKKLSIMTQQDCLDQVTDIHWFLLGTLRNTKTYKPIREKIEALPKPFRVEDINRVLREEDISKIPQWREGLKEGNAFKQTCELCETVQDWVMVLHDVCELDVGSCDLVICGTCINALKEKKLEYLEAAHAESVAKVRGD